MTGLNSSIYECRLMHHRLRPREHRFEYRIFMFWLDLDEIDVISRRVALFSRNHFNAYSFHDRDHATQENSQTKSDVQSWVRQHGVDVRDDDRVMLLTFPRVMGYVFNPVSFYFCHRRNGDAVCAVAEVGNTFGEKKRFLLPQPEDEHRNRFELLVPKHFYVSPFSDLDVSFHFQLRAPEERLAIRVDDYEGEVCVLKSALTGRRFPLTAGRLAWFSLKYPLITLKIILLIHWHALLLYLKKIPFIRKAERPELQRGILTSHETL